MAEQLAFNQFPGQKGAVHMDKRPILSISKPVNFFCQHALSSPALSCDKYRGVQVLYFHDLGFDLRHGGVVSPEQFLWLPGL